jgi:hypothetical protein
VVSARALFRSRRTPIVSVPDTAARGRRRGLLGGPDSAEELSRADLDRRDRERDRSVLAFLAVILIVGLAVSWSDGGLRGLWNLIWFVPLLLVARAIWYGLEALGGALCRGAGKPFRVHTYTPNHYGDDEEEAPDYSMAEIIVDDDNSSPGFPGEGDHAKHGGGAL